MEENSEDHMDEDAIDLELLDYECLDLGMTDLIDVVSRFKSVDTMSEIDDEELVNMINALQQTLFTAIGILYSRGQMWHPGDEEDDDTD